MKRLAVPAALLAALTLPAGALASTPARGTVLSVDGRHHAIQVVAADHSVHAYRYRGHLGHVSAGSVISFRRHGNALSAVHVNGRSRTVSYLARVVRSSGKHLVLRLADGHTVSFSGHSLHHAASRHAHSSQVLAHAAMASAATPGVTIEIQGLAAGTSVMVTESMGADGSLTITITIPPAATATGAPTGGYGDGPTSDASGAITQVDSGSITISTPGGAMTFAVDPTSGLTDGFAVGDVVDVTYTTDASGSNTAQDIEYVEHDAVGAVSAVSAGALTITDSSTGQPDSFTADPSQGMFSGVAVGDQVDVSYHLNGTQMVVDSVDDITADNAAS